jgi:hypothetical protein
MEKNCLIFSILLVVFFLFVFSPAFAQVERITDLRCIVSSEPRSIMLLFTPPQNAIRFDVRYSLSTITEETFNLALQFPQNWQGNTNSGLVTDLTEEKTWFFAIKAIDQNNNYSPISNIAYCYLPHKEVFKDSTPPTSSIIDPENNSTIPASKDYLIKGTSDDTGGSSVRKVEISFDNGKTWFLTEPKESLKNGFTWEYLWKDPKAGTYFLKTRATDWWENQESNLNLIKVIVEEEKEKTPQIPKEEIKEGIEKIKQQLIEIIKQMILALIEELKTKL